MQVAPHVAIVGAQGAPLQSVQGSSHGAAATARLGRAPNAATEKPVARTARHPSSPARRRKRITRQCRRELRPPQGAGPKRHSSLSSLRQAAISRRGANKGARERTAWARPRAKRRSHSSRCMNVASDRVSPTGK